MSDRKRKSKFLETQSEIAIRNVLQTNSAQVWSVIAKDSVNTKGMFLLYDNLFGLYHYSCGSMNKLYFKFSKERLLWLIQKANIPTVSACMHSNFLHY